MLKRNDLRTPTKAYEKNRNDGGMATRRAAQFVVQSALQAVSCFDSGPRGIAEDHRPCSLLSIARFEFLNILTKKVWEKSYSPTLLMFNVALS